METFAQGLKADAGEKLSGDLLGKSKTFKNRQRVGDIMARATDDVQQLNPLLNPGVSITLETILGIIIPIIAITTFSRQLLLVPLCFVAVYIVAVVRYVRSLTPVARRQRDQFGKMNAGLEETISGIEVVKASGQE